MIVALLAALVPVPASAAPPVTSLEATSTLPAENSPGEADHLPFENLPNDRLTVAVTMGEQGPFQFLVDTGADRTVVSKQLATRLGLAPGRTARLHSISGVNDVETVSVSGLKTSSRRLPDVVAPLLDARHVGADGILGTDLLRSAQVRFDFKAGLLSIGPARRAVNRSAYPDTIVVQARRRSGRLIVTEAEAEGQRVVVILDTGSEISIGNQALRRALEKKGRMPLGTLMDLRSVTGASVPATLMSVERLEVGGLTLLGLGIAFADAHTFALMGLTDRPALLLGMNALKAFDSVTIDLAAKKLRFVMPPRRAASAPAPDSQWAPAPRRERTPVRGAAPN